MELMEEVLFYIADEAEAHAVYSRMAESADNAGMSKTAQILRGMAADELRHKEMLEGMYYKPEFGPVREQEISRGTYWEVTNMVTGEILQLGTKFDSVDEAVKHAKKFLVKDFQHYGDDHLVIKVFDKSPDERVGVTYTPIHTESFWVSKAARDRAEEVLGRISESLEFHRPFPQTYVDWVNLAEDIKQRMPPEAWNIVNGLLQVISQEEGPVAEEAKRWLTNKAGELGIT